VFVMYRRRHADAAWLNGNTYREQIFDVEKDPRLPVKSLIR
jgi:hypothetical protein